MVQTQNKLLDDLARLTTGAAGALHGLKAEVEGVVRQKLDRLLAELDLVTREEFEAVKEMAIAARAETEALKARLKDLEEALEKTTRGQK
jgi:BMFP domain-containing protein YqiC